MDDTAVKTAREVLARWADSLPQHPYAGFARELSFISISERPAFVARLITLYDIRSRLGDATVPHHPEQPLPAADIWSRPSGLEKEFIGHEVVISLPISFEPLACPGCEGAGISRCRTCAGMRRVLCPDCAGSLDKKRKSCEQCGGLGKLACESCKGSGYVLADISALGQERQAKCQACAGSGGPVCPKCRASNDCQTCRNERFLACATCRGEGGLPCPQCEGLREVVRAVSYRIEYQPILAQRACLDPEMPAGLLPAQLSSNTLGKIVWEREAEQLGSVQEGLPGGEVVKASVDALLKSAEEGRRGFSGEAQIIKQRLTIDRIAVYFSVYEFSGKKYSCWATELGAKVVAPESPFTDLAVSLVLEAQQSAGRGEPGAEDLLGRAAALSGWPWLEGLKQSLELGQAARAATFWREVGLAIIFLAALALAVSERASHNLFWPLAGFAALAFAGMAGLSRLRALRPKSLAGALALAAGVVAPLSLLFWLAGPPLHLDALEFERLLRQRFTQSIPAALSPEDAYYLKFLIGIYEPMGVDVGAAREALAADAGRIERDRLRREELRLRQAAAELAEKKHDEALRNAIRESKKAAKKKRGRR